MFLIFLNRNRSHNLEEKNIISLFLLQVRANKEKKETKLESDFRGVFEIRMTLSFEEKLTSDKLPIVSSAFHPEDKCSRLFQCGTSRHIKKSLNPLIMFLSILFLRGKEMNFNFQGFPPFFYAIYHPLTMSILRN